MSSNLANVRSLLERRPLPTQATSSQASSQADAESHYSAFAYGRIGRNGQFTLILRLADGSMRAFAYSHFYGIDSENPEVGFTLNFTSHRVTIRGRNLGTLLRLIGQHRVEEIREVDRAFALAENSGDPVVEHILVAVAS